MVITYRLNSVQFEIKDYIGKVKVKSGWDSLNIYKIEKETKNGESIYEANVLNENKGFRLNIIYRFNISSDEDIKKVDDKIKRTIELDGSSIAAIILKYANITSFPIFMGGFENDESKSKGNSKRITRRK